MLIEYVYCWKYIYLPLIGVQEITQGILWKFWGLKWYKALFPLAALSYVSIVGEKLYPSLRIDMRSLHIVWAGLKHARCFQFLGGYVHVYNRHGWNTGVYAEKCYDITSIVTIGYIGVYIHKF